MQFSLFLSLSMAKLVNLLLQKIYLTENNILPLASFKAHNKFTKGLLCLVAAMYRCSLMSKQMSKHLHF